MSIAVAQTGMTTGVELPERQTPDYPRIYEESQEPQLPTNGIADRVEVMRSWLIDIVEQPDAYGPQVYGLQMALARIRQDAAFEIRKMSDDVSATLQGIASLLQNIDQRWAAGRLPALKEDLQFTHNTLYQLLHAEPKTERVRIQHQSDWAQRSLEEMAPHAECCLNSVTC